MGEEYKEIMDEVFDKIMDAGKPVFAQIAPLRSPSSSAQIRETVDQLHQVGVVWGDGKAANVISTKTTMYV